MNGWIGVDLDGTLAEYSEWIGTAHVGAPVPAMVERVLEWLADGVEVRIFTARVAGDGNDAVTAREAIAAWCVEHLGVELPVTCRKDYAMVELWDDRCVRVEMNTGRMLSDSFTMRPRRATMPEAGR